MSDQTHEQRETVKRSGKFWPVLWVVTVLLMSMCLWWSSLPDVGSEVYHESYGPIAIGDSLSDVKAMISGDNYGLIGIFEYNNEEPTWSNYITRQIKRPSLLPLTT